MSCNTRHPFTTLRRARNAVSPSGGPSGRKALAIRKSCACGAVRAAEIGFRREAQALVRNHLLPSWLKSFYRTWWWNNKGQSALDEIPNFDAGQGKPHRHGYVAIMMARFQTGEEWRPISADPAPFLSDLELAVVDYDGPHALVFPCRRVIGGWVKAETKEPVDVRPTHWRHWRF